MSCHNGGWVWGGSLFFFGNNSRTHLTTRRNWREEKLLGSLGLHGVATRRQLRRLYWGALLFSLGHLWEHSRFPAVAIWGIPAGPTCGIKGVIMGFLEWFHWLHINETYSSPRVCVLSSFATFAFLREPLVFDLFVSIYGLLAFGASLLFFLIPYGLFSCIYMFLAISCFLFF